MELVAFNGEDICAHPYLKLQSKRCLPKYSNISNRQEMPAIQIFDQLTSPWTAGIKFQWFSGLWDILCDLKIALEVVLSWRSFLKKRPSPSYEYSTLGKPKIISAKFHWFSLWTPLLISRHQCSKYFNGSALRAPITLRLVCRAKFLPDRPKF